MRSVELLLQPFYGYFELEMYESASEELENLPLKVKTHPTVLLARLDLLLEMERWEDGIIAGKSYCDLYPLQSEFWIKTAYCLHELKRTAQAKSTLMSGPSDMHEQPIYLYNLAGYEAQLGNLNEAKRLLRECFKKDKSYRQASLTDPDLKPVWNSLEELSR